MKPWLTSDLPPPGPAPDDRYRGRILIGTACSLALVVSIGLLQGMAEGTGIGLASVRKAVELQHGQLWVESPGEGRGSTFCFTLPRNPDPANPP